MLKTIIDWILPITCVVCQRNCPQYFCEGCLLDLPWLINPCEGCSNEIVKFPNLSVCGECMIDPPIFTKNFALFRYDFPIPSLVTQLKFRKKLSLAQAFGYLLLQKIQERYQHDHLPDYVIPVPLHNNRLSERGYNQALEIARPLKKLGLSINYREVKRILATRPQTLIEIDDRAKNVKGAFSVANGFECQHVAIVDDVITTFSTVTELAVTLKRHGVQRVDVWCIARGGLK